jgi:hypothetical protein
MNSPGQKLKGNNIAVFIFSVKPLVKNDTYLKAKDLTLNEEMNEMIHYFPS